MKIKDVRIAKSVTIGLKNYGSFKCEYGATLSEGTVEELSTHVDTHLQREVDKTLTNIGQGQSITIVKGK